MMENLNDREKNAIIRAGYLVGLVDKWYANNNYNVRLGQIVFSKRNPSIKDVKLSLYEALRRVGIKEDLKETLKEKLNNLKEIEDFLSIRDEERKEVDIGLLFSIGYYEGFSQL